MPPLKKLTEKATGKGNSDEVLASPAGSQHDESSVEHEDEEPEEPEVKNKSYEPPTTRSSKTGKVAAKTTGKAAKIKQGAIPKSTPPKTIAKKKGARMETSWTEDRQDKVNIVDIFTESAGANKRLIKAALLTYVTKMDAKLNNQDLVV